MPKVLRREVDAACAEYGRAATTWGEHNQITQRAFCRYWELREQWEQATGKCYGELKS